MVTAWPVSIATIWLGFSGILPAQTVSITEYPTPESVPSQAANIIAGTDGSLWFTEEATNKIGRLSPSGSLVEYAISGSPSGITVGPDGAVWFTESGSETGAIVGRITFTGVLTEFKNLLQGSFLFLGGPIAAGSDGALWLSIGECLDLGPPGPCVSSLYRMTTDGTLCQILSFGSAVLSSGPTAAGIVSGPDGALW